jgi:hypothetical protein
MCITKSVGQGIELGMYYYGTPLHQCTLSQASLEHSIGRIVLSFVGSRLWHSTSISRYVLRMVALNSSVCGYVRNSPIRGGANLWETQNINPGRDDGGSTTLQPFR